MPKDIKSMYEDELKEELALMGEPSYRASQIYQWLHKGVKTFDEMTNISKKTREKLVENYYIFSATIEKKLISSYDDTRKYLLSFSDGENVESVLMHYHHGYTSCISTQVGCKMGCTFCATGQGGFSRNLTPSEMIAQLQAEQEDAGIRISNIVLMGMGEPLDNFDNVVRFLKLVSSEKGMNIGMRHISLSTCGIVPRIYELADMQMQLTLSVSLHAPNDQIRSRTMPINRKYGIDELLKACRYYISRTGRRISFEYAMIDGVNDSAGCANELASRLKGMLAHVNLIPVNEVGGTGYQKSRKDRIQGFISILEKAGITATVRRTLGSDINASCGQLRRAAADTKKEEDREE